MTIEQKQPTPEQMGQERAEQTPKVPETAEELRAQVEAQKKQNQQEFRDILKRAQDWSAQQKGPEVNPVGTQVELDTLGQEAQTTVQEADTQLDQLTAEGQDTAQISPDQKGISEQDVREKAKQEIVEQKVQEMLAKHPDSTQESIDATRRQFEKIFNIKIDDNDIHRRYIEEHQKFASQRRDEKSKLQQQLEATEDPEKRKDLEGTIAKKDEDIKYLDSVVVERQRMIDGSLDGKTTDRPVSTAPTMEQGKSYVGTKKNPDGSVDMTRALESKDNVAEKSGEEIKFESGQVVSLKRPESDVLESGWTITEIQDADYGKYVTATSPDGKTDVSMPASELSKFNQITPEQPTASKAEATVQKGAEKIKPGFELTTIKLNESLSEWSDQELQGKLIPHLQNMLSQLEKGRDTAYSQLQVQTRIDDVKNDLNNVLNYIAARSGEVSTSRSKQPEQKPVSKTTEQPLVSASENSSEAKPADKPSGKSPEQAQAKVEQRSEEVSTPSTSGGDNAEAKPVEAKTVEEAKPEAKPADEKKQLDKKGVDQLIRSVTDEIHDGVDGARKEELTNLLTEVLNQSNDKHQLFNGADQLMLMKKYDSAIAFYKKAEENNTVGGLANARSVYELSSSIATRLAECGEYDGARESLEKAQKLGATEHNPNYQSAVKFVSRRSSTLGKLFRRR